MIIGLLHPGSMGAAVGAALAARGHDVIWDPTGRSADTIERASGLRPVAGAAGLTGDAGAAGAAGAARAARAAGAAGLAALVAESSVIVSVCPPHGAVDLAEAVARAGPLTDTTYLDANAIAPATARTVAGIVERAGGRYVDGGIIGPPPAAGQPCRLVLSGPFAAPLASELANPDAGLEVAVIPEGATAASALKMTYAAWSKGTAALILAIRAAARQEGVEAALVAEWERSAPEPLARSAGAAASAETKGWRWIGEMDEIARTLADAGLPGGFHLAAADVYRLAGTDPALLFGGSGDGAVGGSDGGPADGLPSE